jgi:hypothetical protein
VLEHPSAKPLDQQPGIELTDAEADAIDAERNELGGDQLSQGAPSCAAEPASSASTAAAEDASSDKTKKKKKKKKGTNDAKNTASADVHTSVDTSAASSAAAASVSAATAAAPVKAAASRIVQTVTHEFDFSTTQDSAPILKIREVGMDWTGDVFGREAEEDTTGMCMCVCAWFNSDSVSGDVQCG